MANPRPMQRVKPARSSPMLDRLTFGWWGRTRDSVLGRLEVKHGHLRVGRLATMILGPEYQRARRRIEIDITYVCNLTCANCDRSCGQAPSAEHMTLDQIDHFLQESIAKGIKWERIRLIGGEPTLHPDFLEILSRLLRYRDESSKDTILDVSTNGSGRKVQSIIEQIPPTVRINNTSKQPDVQPPFDSFNVAPRDLPEYKNADYRNGCWISEHCGIGLSSGGFYPCGAAGGIDRIFGWDLGRKTLPDDDDPMWDMLERFCSHCGHFKRIPDPLLTEQVSSPSWEQAYENYERSKPKRTKYGSSNFTPG